MAGSGSEGGSAALLIDSLKAADRELAKLQARRARLMVEFAATRRKADQHRIAEMEAEGADPRSKAGEFASTEIGLAVTTTRAKVERLVSMTRRLQSETPDVWDAWIAGDINELKAERINHALVRLVRNQSKRLLNMLVVPVAITKTPELLGRWLNRFVANVEPDQADERIRRSLEDRYASIRPDLDGVSFLSACMSSLAATAVDLLLDGLAGPPNPADPRTKDQRRADALVDLLLGRISNGWHGPDCWDKQDAPTGVSGDVGEPRTDSAHDDDSPADDGSSPTANQEWDEDADWDLPASEFRPDPRNEPDTDSAAADSAAESVDRSADDGPVNDGTAETAAIIEAARRARPTGCLGQPPPRVTIGVVVSIQSLFGFTDTPGELADRSALVPAELIREMAGDEGTLFYRLLTDPSGNLLDVAEMGRFPSRNLTAALRFRDGVCENPICHVSAQRCDLDHVVPWPDGLTAAGNLDATCRHHHRAKTHGGFGVTKAGDGTTWTTPTGHRYSATTDPFPVEPWPDTG
ncbi:DUF222 domain-containing protein [Nakamurella sp.]|uniref:HNH endonuclease signature motif containing protein n=1 Tax=Nakamurella sp. TaxID=1869182 RepID=UPI0037850071